MTTPEKQTNQSRVTNGSAYFLETKNIDSRTERARRIRDHHALLAKELGRTPTDAQDAILRRAAAMATVCELYEGQIASGEDIDEGRYLQLSKELRACLVQVGITRPTRDLTKAEANGTDEHAAALMDA